jgi:hypothetical protein
VRDRKPLATGDSGTATAPQAQTQIVAGIHCRIPATQPRYGTYAEGSNPSRGASTTRDERPVHEERDGPDGQCYGAASLRPDNPIATRTIGNSHPPHHNFTSS